MTGIPRLFAREVNDAVDGAGRRAQNRPMAFCRAARVWNSATAAVLLMVPLGACQLSPTSPTAPPEVRFVHVFEGAQYVETWRQAPGSRWEFQTSTFFPAVLGDTLALDPVRQRPFVFRPTTTGTRVLALALDSQTQQWRAALAEFEVPGTATALHPDGTAVLVRNVDHFELFPLCPAGGAACVPRWVLPATLQEFRLSPGWDGLWEARLTAGFQAPWVIDVQFHSVGAQGAAAVGPPARLMLPDPGLAPDECRLGNTCGPAYTARLSYADVRGRFVIVTVTYQWAVFVSAGGRSRHFTFQVLTQPDGSVDPNGVREIAPLTPALGEPQGLRAFGPFAPSEAFAIDGATLEITRAADPNGTPASSIQFVGQGELAVAQQSSPSSPRAVQLLRWNSEFTRYDDLGAPFTPTVAATAFVVDTGGALARPLPDLLAVSSPATRTLTSFSVDGVTGLATARDRVVFATNSPGPPRIPGPVIAGPGGARIAIDRDSGSRFASIDAVNGSIAVSSSLDITGPVRDFVLDPGGDVVFALAPQQVLARRFEFGGGVGSAIQLPALWPTGFPAGVAPSRLALDPTGRVLVVAFDGHGTIASYRIDRAALRATPSIGGASFVGTTDLYVSGAVAVADVAIDAVGGYVLAVLSSHNELRLLRIDAAGVLSPPADYRQTGLAPTALAVTADGQHVYVLNARSRTITQFGGAPSYARIADVPVSNSPFVLGESDLAVDEAGRWLFVSNTAANSIDIFAIAPGTGSLSRAWTVTTPSPGPLSLRHRVQ